MKKLCAVVFGVCVMFGAFADTYTWTGAAGDGLWATRDNWDPRAPEGGPGSADFVFPSGDWTIRKDNSSYYYSIALEGEIGTITFVGDGKFQAASTVSITIPEGRELCFDGPSITLPKNQVWGGVLRIKAGSVGIQQDNNGMSLGGDGKIIIEGGKFSSSQTLFITNNMELVVCGGTASCSTYWKVFGPDAPGEPGASIRLASGSFVYDRSYAARIVQEGGRFENLGGTIIWGQGNATSQNRLMSGDGSYGQGEAFKDFLPPVGGRLIIPTSSESGALYFNSLDGEYDVGGSIYTTNAASAKSGSIYFDSCNVTLRGGAAVYANNLRFAGKKTVDLDLSSVNLGSGGYVGSSSTTTLNYRDGITFGAWADWSEADAANVTTSIEGPLAFETKDCFDGETARNISLSAVNLKDTTELSVRGGGSVAVADATFKEEFRTLEVADGTTLELTGSAPQLKTMNLKLGVNAALKVDLAKGGYVDAAAVAEFGEGARIVVTALPATLTEKALYPIYFAPVGTTPDMTKIEFAEGVLPEGWALAKTANSVYLTDGKVEPYGGLETRYWTGAGADNLYETAENWVSNSVTTGSATAYFFGASNTEISITSEMKIRQFGIGADAGPFVFSGSAVTYQYPGSPEAGSNHASVRNDGKFPVVVANTVGAGNGGVLYRFVSIGEGSVSMTGGSKDAVASFPLDFCGDVRLGGVWNVTSLRALCKNFSTGFASKTAARSSRLTVMPNAVLTVTEQTGDVNVASKGALAIAKGGAVMVDGAELTMSSNNTHYVDGTLAVNCPLVTPARQTFRGDGTLKLLGGVAASETGSVRVEGDLTLVPSNWVNAVTLSVKDNVTLAPEDDWTFGDDGVLEVVNHSTLTLAAGGHKVSLAKPIVTEGTIALKGAGRYEIAAAGMKIRKVTCANGATISVADGVIGKTGFTDILTVREPDDSIAFDEHLKIKMRYDLLTDETIYSAKVKQGLLLLLR